MTILPIILPDGYGLRHYKDGFRKYKLHRRSPSKRLSSFAQIKKNCLMCGNEFWAKRYKVNYHHTCSRSCGQQYRQRREMNGPKKRLDRGTGWDTARKACYERDNYTCQMCSLNCKEEQRRLNAHHIFPYHRGVLTTCLI